MSNPIAVIGWTLIIIVVCLGLYLAGCAIKAGIDACTPGYWDRVMIEQDTEAKLKALKKLQQQGYYTNLAPTDIYIFDLYD